MPPSDLWLGYGSSAETYVDSGKEHLDQMLAIAPLPGAVGDRSQRILDFGCGGGRMLRHLLPWVDHSEIWGMDISARHINWLKTQLSPPFHFATNTTIPHLPFSDGYFDYIYCGSLFTHIEDLAESWFLEVARIIRPGGTFYCTLHDEHAAEVVVKLGIALADTIDHDPTQVRGIAVIGRDSESSVFYHSTYLRNLFSTMFEIVRVEHEAYGYQTAWVLRKK